MRNRVLTGMAALVVMMSGALCVAEHQMAAPATPKDPVFQALNGLLGIWEVTSPKEFAGDNPKLVVFKSTSGGSAIMETMFPRDPEEMVNMYTADDKGVVMTHYCHMGNQPRMRASKIDNGVVKFEFVDGGNLKSRDDGHMDSLEMKIDGDKLTEKWTLYMDGKVAKEMVFEMKKKK